MTEKAQAIQNMTETTGWKIVEEYIRERMDGHKNQLMTCSMQDILKHRAEVKALNGVLLFIQDAIREGSEPDA